MSRVSSAGSWLSPVGGLITTLAVTLALAAWAQARIPARDLAACAAFAPDGGWVAGTTDGEHLSVKIGDAAGVASRLDMALPPPRFSGLPISCRAYFDLPGDLAAVGVSYGWQKLLRLGVIDVKRASWIATWTVGPASGIARPRLNGFLAGTADVVVSGQPSVPTPMGLGTGWGSYWSIRFDAQGRRLGLTKRQYGPPTDLSPFYADASHNRLWLLGCVMVSGPWSRQPDCPVRWVTLTGPASSSPEFDPRPAGAKRTDFWMAPGAFATPDGHTILIAGNPLERVNVWVVDMRQRAVSWIALPKHAHFPHLQEVYGRTCISPDGAIAAIPLLRESLAFPYLLDNYHYQGTDFAVEQLHPLRLLGVLRGAGRKSPGACAVEGRGGQVRALIFRHHRWDFVNLRPQP